MPNYDALAATADRLIRDSGREIRLDKLSRSPVDPSKPWRAPTAVVTSVTVTGVFVEQGESADVDESLVRRGRRGFLVSAQSVGSQDPKLFDVVVDGSTTWKIDRVNELKPGSTSLMFGIEVSQ